MQKTLRLILSLALGLAIAVTLGWMWGASGRASAENLLQAKEVQLGLYRARAHLLEARVDLYNLNFGEASRHLENAKEALRTAKSHLRRSERSDRGGAYDQAIASIDGAQRLANKLDQSANTRAAEAVKQLDSVMARHDTLR